MNQYQKIALVVLRAEGYLVVLYALREFFAVTVYVPTMYLGLLPKFYFNVGGAIFWGILTMTAGLLILGISRPLARIIGARLETEEAD